MTTTQLPVWEQTINGLNFTELTRFELIDFIAGHADDARLTPEEYITTTFESEAAFSLENAPNEDTFGFTIDDACEVVSIFSN